MFFLLERRDLVRERSDAERSGRTTPTSKRRRSLLVMPVSIARASLKRSRRMREHSIARRREHLRTDGGDTVAKEDGVSEEEVDRAFWPS